MTIDYTQANAIFASIADAPPAAIRMLARALTLAGGPLAGFGTAFAYYATAREHGDESSDLARLKLTHEIRTTAKFGDRDALLERLDGITEPPWPAIREALETARLRQLGRACDEAEAGDVTDGA